MSAYPDTPVPAEGYEGEQSYATVVGGPYASGGYTSASLRPYGLYTVRLNYNAAPETSFASLFALFESMKGRHGTFTFFDFYGHDSSPVGRAWIKLLVKVCAGSETVLDLPMKNSSTYILYKNGSAVTEGAGAGKFVFSGGTGTDGRDKVTLGTAADTGDLFEWSGTGRRAVRASFAEDKLTLKAYANKLVTASVSIIERPVVG